MEYQISKERLRKLVFKIIKSIEIEGLYRIQFDITDKGYMVVALFFDIVRESVFFHNIQKEVENRIKDFLGIESLHVITIPYSEAKYHLREPRNV